MKIQVNLVLEILGRPKEHLKESLNTLVVRLGAEKGVKILSKEYHEPVEVEQNKNLFTAFAEVSIECESIQTFFGMVFGYMPAHIELVSPENIELSNSDLNGLANNILQRLHNYDAVTKNSMVERDIALRKLYEIAPHLFKKQESTQTGMPATLVPAKKENKASKAKKKKSKK